MLFRSLGAAKGATITLEVSKVAKPTEAQKKAAGANGHVISLTVKSGNQIISDFNKGKATVMVELVSRLLGKKVAAIHIADDGTIEQLAGKVLTVGGKQYYEFATPHFSTFAIVAVISFEEKPIVAETNTASIGVYVVRRRQLIELLEA